MIQMPHIAVIGGGLLGLSCADSLMRRGAKITIYEKKMNVGRGAAEFNSGMIHPSQTAPWLVDYEIDNFRAVYDLALKSRGLLRSRQKSLGLDTDRRESGTLQLFDSRYLGERARAQYESRNIQADLYRGEWNFGRYCLKFPNDMSGDASVYMNALKQDLISQGCNIVTGQKIETIKEINSEVDAIIIACGADSDLFLELPVRAEPGHALIFPVPDIALPKMPIMHAHSHSALTTFPNHIRLSGTLNEDSPDALLEIWDEIAPDLIKKMGRPYKKWTANRPASLLGRPIIGPAGFNKVYVCTGHGHMGWTLCAGSAELMADIILDGRAVPEFAVP